MKHLLTPHEENGKSVVSARHLYEYLDIKTDFSNWCKRMFEYGFVNGVDYSLAKNGEPSVHNKTDYALTIDCAKEISMLQRTELGKQARLYFIECERLAMKSIPQTFEEMTLTVITTLKSNVEEYRMKLVQANNTIIEQAPIVQYVNEVLSAPNLISTTIIAKDLGMSATALNRLLYKRGIHYKQGETWVLYSKYQDKEYTHTKTHTYFDQEGRKKTAIHTYWTERGRHFIYELFNKSLMTA